MSLSFSFLQMSAQTPSCFLILTHTMERGFPTVSLLVMPCYSCIDTSGLTLPQNNGLVEGKVNKLKLIKRMMYGRAEFPRLASARAARLVESNLSYESLVQTLLQTAFSSWVVSPLHDGLVGRASGLFL